MKALICILGLFGAGLGSPAFAQCRLNISCGHSPEGLAFDSSGNLWATFYDTNTVANLGVPQGNIIYAPASVTSFQRGLSGPTRLAFYNSFLLVTNSTGNTVTVYAAPEAGTPLLATVSGVQRPLGVAVDGNGNLFVADNSTSAITGFPYPYTHNQGSISTDGNGHPFDAPGALAYNGQNIFVATNDGSVHSYNEVWFEFAFELLAEGYGVDEGLLMELVTFADGASGGPTGIAFDSQGNVYVCYYYSSDVVKYSPQGVKLMTMTDLVSQPEGIAVQPSTGEIYVANTGNGGSINAYNPDGSYNGTLMDLVFE
jgi:DNA-binding beta-propeller fold protein YncE